MKTNPDYTLLDHTADLGIRIRGADLMDLFRNAGCALMHLMIRGVSPERPSPVSISLTAGDLCDLMVRWLGEILYLFDGEGLVVTEIEIRSLTTYGLEAVLETVPLDLDHHEILNEIKAITYHQIEVARKEDHLEARVIMDL